MKSNKTACRLELRFADTGAAKLEQTCFWFGQTETRVVQPFGEVKGLAWDKNAMSLCYWLIHYRLSKHDPGKGLYEVAGETARELFDTLLNLLDTPREFCMVFGKEPDKGANARNVLKLVFPQANPRKHRRATIDPRLLPPKSILIRRGAREVDDRRLLNKLARQIERAYAQQPSRKKDAAAELPVMTPTPPPPVQPMCIVPAPAVHETLVSSEENVPHTIKNLPDDPRRPTCEGRFANLEEAPKAAAEAKHQPATRLPYDFPLPPPKFFGHAELRAQTKDKLARPGLLVLHETGGMGKTTFATQVAHDASEAGFLPGSAVWINCETHPNLEHCLAKLAEHLIGGPNGGPSPDAQTEKKLAEYFEKAHTLVVLDNFEFAIRDHDLNRWLQNNRDNACFLITTREVHEGMTEPGAAEFVTLHELDPDAAFDLFQHHAAKPSLSNEETEVIRRLCQAVGYSPLAILMLGRHAQHITVEELEEHFKLDLKRILKTGNTMLCDCHESMEACFRVSLHSLSGDDLDALYRLSISSVGLHEDLARDCLEPLQRLDSLPRLVDRALLRKESGRYTLHPLWRMLLHREMGASIDRWQDEFTEFMMEYAESRREVRPAHEKDFTAVLRLCVDLGKWKPFARICRAVTEIPGHFYSSHDYAASQWAGDDVDVFERAQKALKNQPEDLVCILLVRARTAWDGWNWYEPDHPILSGDMESGVTTEWARLWIRILELSCRVGDREAEIEALHAMAHFHLFDGSLAKAEEALRRVLSLCQWNGQADSALIESVLLHLVEALNRQHRQDKRKEAVVTLEILREAWEKRLPQHLPGDPRVRNSRQVAANLFLTCTHTLIQLREWKKARRWLAMSLKTWHDLVGLDPHDSDELHRRLAEFDCFKPRVLSSIALIRRAQGRSEKTLKLYRDVVVKDLRLFAFRNPLAEAFLGAAEVVAVDGDLKAAVELAQYALDVDSKIEETYRILKGREKVQSSEPTAAAPDHTANPIRELIKKWTEELEERTEKKQSRGKRRGK